LHFLNKENTKENFKLEIMKYPGNLFENIENCKLLKKNIGRS
jgi:hypothetical protein